MQPHALPLVRRQRPRLVPDRQRDRDPPEVVDERRAAHAHRVDPAGPAALRRRARHLRHPRRVPDEIRRGEVGEVAHRGQRAVDRLALETQPRRRLGREHAVPGGALGDAREDRLDVVGEPGGDDRVEGVPGAAAHHLRGHLRTADHAVEGGVAGDVHDAHGERDPLAPRSPSTPLPSQRSVNAANSPWIEGGSPSRSVSISPTSHSRRDVAPVAPRPRAAACAPPRRPAPALPLQRRERAQGREQGLALRPEHGRRQVRRPAPTRRTGPPPPPPPPCSRRRTAGTRSTSAAVSASTPSRSAQPHRRERALEPVLEREPGGEVRGQ